MFKSTGIKSQQDTKIPFSAGVASKVLVAILSYLIGLLLLTQISQDRIQLGIGTWIRYCDQIKGWDIFTVFCHNFTGGGYEETTLEVRMWIHNYTLQKTMVVVTYPCHIPSESLLVKGGPAINDMNLLEYNRYEYTSLWCLALVILWGLVEHNS